MVLCVFVVGSQKPSDLKQDEPEPSAPVFDLMPEAQQVEEADTAKFMVKVSGHPRPRLTWWINGAMVVSVSIALFTGTLCWYCPRAHCNRTLDA